MPVEEIIATLPTRMLEVLPAAKSRENEWLQIILRFPRATSLVEAVKLYNSAEYKREENRRKLELDVLNLLSDQEIEAIYRSCLDQGFRALIEAVQTSLEPEELNACIADSPRASELLLPILVENFKVNRAQGKLFLDQIHEQMIIRITVGLAYSDFFATDRISKETLRTAFAEPFAVIETRLDELIQEAADTTEVAFIIYRTHDTDTMRRFYTTIVSSAPSLKGQRKIWDNAQDEIDEIQPGIETSKWITSFADFICQQLADFLVLFTSKFNNSFQQIYKTTLNDHFAALRNSHTLSPDQKIKLFKRNVRFELLFLQALHFQAEQFAVRQLMIFSQHNIVLLSLLEPYLTELLVVKAREILINTIYNNLGFINNFTWPRLEKRARIEARPRTPSF